LSRPGVYQPELLATYLQSAAKAGSRDVERFKKDWHGEDVRELWQTVHANDLPQGGDAWPVDYGGLLQDVAANEESTIGGLHGNPLYQPPTEAEIAKVVHEFGVRHPELSIHVSDGATTLPIDIEVANVELRVGQRQAGGAVEFSVIGKPGTEASTLRQNILDSISESNDSTDLLRVLVRPSVLNYATSED
jgi:hypothetical protein